MAPDTTTTTAPGKRSPDWWRSVESACQGRWADSKAFEAEPDDSRPKKFITVAYPYPNSPQHIGHGRTYTLADVHARFWRLRGYNVLFPMGFHYTGTPILGMARRVQDKDAELIGNLRDIYGVSERDIGTFCRPPYNRALLSQRDQDGHEGDGLLDRLEARVYHHRTRRTPSLSSGRSQRSAG